MNSILGSGLLGSAAQGVLGGAQGMSLEDQQYHQLSQRYTQALGQSMLNTQQAAAQNVFGQAAKGAQAIPFNPNEIEAYKVPLSTLVTLWQAKFGDEWVSKFDDEFWFNATDRLKEAGKVEVVKHTWYRIKEDA